MKVIIRTKINEKYVHKFERKMKADFAGDQAELVIATTVTLSMPLFLVIKRKMEKKLRAFS